MLGAGSMRTVTAAKTRKEMAKSRVTSIVVPEMASIVEEVNEAALARFFSIEDTHIPSEPITAVLSVPLNPSISTAVGGESALLPLPLSSPPTFEVIEGIHIAYTQHSLRVANLFARLDRANVWERGAWCKAVDIMGEGVCGALHVEFHGWPEEVIKGVLGDLYGEEWFDLSITSQTAPLATSPAFIMPTLDFSVSSLSRMDSVDSTYTSRWLEDQTQLPLPEADWEGESLEFSSDSEDFRVTESSGDDLSESWNMGGSIV